MSSPLLHPPCFSSSSHLSFSRSAAGFSPTLLRHAGCYQASFLFHQCRVKHRGYDTKNIRCMTYSSKLAMIKDSDSTSLEMLIKEPHKYFDHVNISVRSGDGGHGAVLCLPAQRTSSKSKGKDDQDKSKKGSFKRDSNGSLILPMGGHGGDVFLYADESTETLLEFHKKKRYNAKRGGNVDAMGMLTSVLHDGFVAPSLRIPVPVGTVVKRKKGKFMADLARPGDEILVARGGQGGISLLEIPEHKRKRLTTLPTNVMRDESDKVLVLGQPGEEVSLELILRVVADVGLVGLPNAGKSTLLGAITLAKPGIADYPFTTLMPNLGRLDGDPSLGALRYSSGATLADLPGLIEGAHLGKGLGRNFLRHLRRTRLLVHVVDAAAEDPVNDYMTVKEELRMYNPEYLERPYIVVLNKIDIPEAQDRLPLIAQEIRTIGLVATPKTELSKSLPNRISDGNLLPSLSLREEQKEKGIQDYPRPLAVVGASVLKHIGVDNVLKEVRAALRKCHDLDMEVTARTQ
ncbi:hypothetical protein KFK09_011925 [Dendrobium nobile]|uniref:GTP-binding protein OBGC2 n=1 Tax=Dendrobium nobile TaxID=94219 RepID=A0A8T3BG89_DENNO|nr:hypothetical protein KFK09_011925 [Dendrobium nobile]